MQYMNIRKYITTKGVIILAISLALSSCISIKEYTDGELATYRPNSELTKTQRIIVESALEACSKSYNKTLIFSGRQFNNDCSGLIYGIFWTANIDLLSAISSESGNGVMRLYRYMDKKKLIHTEKLPQPGDLIFWNNTYGTWGRKPLSHIGIVVSVDRDTGSIDYVHNNTYLGAIRREKMNLYRPHENRPINNYMRYDSKYKKTAAELFDSFGMAWKL